MTDGVDRDNWSGPSDPEKAAGRAEGRALRNTAMAKVEEHNAYVFEQFVESGWRVARRMYDLIGDDVHDEFDRLGITCREPRVLGPVMKALQRAGAITPTSPAEYRKGHRPGNHVRPQLVWLSCVYEVPVLVQQPPKTLPLLEGVETWT